MEKYIRPKADELRVKLLGLSDEELISFSGACFAGEDVAGKPFECVIDRIKRVAKQHDDNIHVPF